MQSLNIKIPSSFKEELRRRAIQDRVPDRIYVIKALQEKFGWPLESLPVGNNYRPQPLNNPWAATQNAGVFDEEDFDELRELEKIGFYIDGKNIDLTKLEKALLPAFKRKTTKEEEFKIPCMSKRQAANYLRGEES